MFQNRPTYHLARFFFLKFVALVFLVAFVSAFLQLPGLMGSHGLLPASHMISEASRLLPMVWKRYWIFPTFCWISSGDASLNFQCGLGMLAALGALVGLAPGFLMAVCWALYLSVVQAGQEFFNWPLDSLLLECGLLSVFLAPWRRSWWRPNTASDEPPSTWQLALALSVLAKCFILPGLGHLCLGDPTWPTWTALSFQFWTQPLPTSFGLLLARFPSSILKGLTALVLLVEIGAPLFLPFSAKIRRLAFYPLTALGLGQCVTGDTLWTGVLLGALCLWALDDNSFPGTVRAEFLKLSLCDSEPKKHSPFSYLPLGLYSGILGITFIGFFIGLFGYQPLGAVGNWVYRAVYPTHSFNSYLSAEGIRSHRFDLTVEGTADGLLWKEYTFKLKPGDPMGAPPWFNGMPQRLDALVAEAPKGDCQDSPFLAQLCAALLSGNRDVLALLGPNPFASMPPASVRIRKMEYRLADGKTRKETGAVWTKVLIGDFCPEIKLPEK